MGDKAQRMEPPTTTSVTIMDQINNFFTPKNEQVIVQEKTSRRVFYEREVDPDLEMLNKLEKRVADLDQNVERVNKILIPLTTEIKTLRLKYDAMPNKNSTQALALRQKCIECMAEQDTLQKRIERYKQDRRTVNTQAENFRLIKDAERSQQLMMDSNRAMYGTMATLDMSTVQSTASDARNASREVNKMMSLLIDPFGVTCEEVNNTFASKFDALDFTDDPYLEDQETNFVVSPSRLPQQQQQERKSALLEDDIF